MNKKQFEKHLNESYADNYTEEQLYDDLVYLTVKGRTGGSISQNRLRLAIVNHCAGTILRKYDPIAFQCAYNDRNS
jgi:hypothetical protein